MKSDRGYAAVIFGIQFSYCSNEANGSLTPVDHRNSAWKRHCQGASVGHAVSLGLKAAAHYPFGTDCCELIVVSGAAGGGGLPPLVHERAACKRPSSALDTSSACML